jgi:nicotinamidase-related amidase
MTHTDNALIVVDYQKGFIPLEEWGTWELPVEWGWLLAPRINELMNETRTQWGLIIGTRDCHPQGHMSFASNYKWKNPFETVDWDEVVNSLPKKLELEDTANFNLADLQVEFWAKWNQMLWPDHCVENTPWAEYHDELDTTLIDHHIIKWYDPTTEMYSGFFWKEDTAEWRTITEILQELWVKTVRIVGLATDYCIESTAVDSVKNGCKTIIDSSAIRWVAISPEDTVAYLEALREKEGVDFE